MCVKVSKVSGATCVWRASRLADATGNASRTHVYLHSELLQIQWTVGGSERSDVLRLRYEIARVVALATNLVLKCLCGVKWYVIYFIYV